ncbi:MAG: methyltransferase domain-containing protein [Acidimicrobiaceae bacterium]|nr:methyltransferase domain-containing protein [Acidimicrobiaceae bacterium]
MTGALDDGGIPRAADLLQDFLADRHQRTTEAYAADLAEFARFSNEELAASVARLLSSGPNAASRLVKEYGLALMRMGRAETTIRRRFMTIRSLVGLARARGIVEWRLEVPSPSELEAGREAAPAIDSPHYLFPREPEETDRLDLQHYALRTALGTNHQALLERPALILDVGSGGGQWGWDTAEEFPDALVVGLDLVPGKASRPRGFQPLRADLLKGLPFRDAVFDYVHQRLLLSGIPALAWPRVVRDLVRVTKPGGWIELVEPVAVLQGGGPAVDRVWGHFLAAAAARGLDTSGEVAESLARYLREAGAREVQRRKVELPVGEWGGRVGSLLASDFRVGLTRVLEAHPALQIEERSELLRQAIQEFEEQHVTMTLVFAHGQKVDVAPSSFVPLSPEAWRGQSQGGVPGRGPYLISREQAIGAIRAWILEHGRPPRWPEWERAKASPSAKTIQRRWGWHKLLSEVVAGPDLRGRPSAYWSSRQRPRLRGYSDSEIIDSLRAAHDELGRWPYATEWDRATPDHPGRRTVVRRFGSWSAATMAARTARESSPAPARKPRTPVAKGLRWTREAIIEALIRWHREHGRWPTCNHWRHAGPWWPSFSTVLGRFESWSAAVAAADDSASGAVEA